MLLAGCGNAVETTGGSSTSSASSSTSIDASSGQTATSGTSSSSSGSADSTTVGPASSSSSSTTGDGGSTTGRVPPADAGCPECIVLVDELVGGRGLAVDEMYVYFTDQDQGTVSRIMKDGGDGGVLIEGQDSPYDVAVDGTHVYWTNFANDGAVMRAPKAGGVAEVVATVSRPRPVAVDATHVYWGTFESDNGDVSRRTLDLDEPEELLGSLSGGIPELVVGDGQLYWTAHASAGITFITDPNDPIGGVFSAPLDGTADPFNVTSLAADQAQPWGIARTPAGQLVWVNGDGAVPNLPNRIMTLEDTEQPAALYGGATAPWGVAVDATFAYWTDNDRVMAFPLEGGDVVLLAEQQNVARSIGVDGDAVFWVTRTRVLQRPKPTP